MNGRSLANTTWTELERHWGSAVVLVPLGATEQHGPHLPLGTDTTLAHAICHAAAEYVPGVCVAPVMPFGASGEHAGFPGTMSIGTGAMTEVLVELGRSVLPEAHAVVFASAHGGNDEAVRNACARLQQEGRGAHAWHPRVASTDLHAGHDETSLMHHLSPAEVRVDRVTDFPIINTAETLRALRATGVQAVSPSGVLGTPSTANPAAGQELFAALVQDLSALLVSVSQTP